MTLEDRCISASLATIEFLPADDGTDVVLTHQGAFFEGAGGHICVKMDGASYWRG
jgi:hypothetical protein